MDNAFTFAVSQPMYCGADCLTYQMRITGSIWAGRAVSRTVRLLLVSSATGSLGGLRQLVSWSEEQYVGCDRAVPSISTTPPSECTIVALTTRGTMSAPPVHNSISRSLRLKPGLSHDLCKPSPALALLDDRSHGGYAGVRLGEAQNLGSATHDKDRAAAEQRNASLRRISEAGDSVPSSQDSVTRGVQNLKISVTPATQTALPAPARAAETTASSIPSLCAMWLRSLRLQSSLRPRPHAARGSETRRTTAAPGKR